MSFAMIALESTPMVDSFAVLPSHPPSTSTTPVTMLFAEAEDTAAKEETPKAKAPVKSSYDPEEEVQKRLAQARAVLAKSKAKLESRQQQQQQEASSDASKPAAAATSTAPLPFFAAKKATKDPQRKDKLIKSKDDKTGLITADGEVMAAMSEVEEWERRSLLEVFENEMDENEDVYSLASQQLAERDVVASIWNLRKSMKTEDYMKIFDKKNRFIGEDN